MTIDEIKIALLNDESFIRKLHLKQIQVKNWNIAPLIDESQRQYVDAWVKDRCYIGFGWTDASTLFNDYRWWSKNNEWNDMSRRRFGAILTFILRGKAKRKNSRIEYNLTLRPEEMIVEGL